jgi:uncharacterized C2H2 Zn-finger protein
MAHKFFLQFKRSWITRRGAKLEGFVKTGKVHPGTGKCYEYVIKDIEEANPESVQVAPVHHRRQPWLFGPATRLSSRSIVYPCNRGKCSVPCPCLLCRKKHPRCRAGQSCGCKECKLYFENHSNYHGCLHIGCKSCCNITSVLPHFDFHFLDKNRKLCSRSVWLEDKLEPKFQLPPPTELRRDMISQFLTAKKWSEKLNNWNSNVEDDGIWCLGCSTMFFSTEKLRTHILSKHHVKMFYHNCENDDTKPLPELQCDQCSSSFGTKGELTRHVESVHYKEWIECPDCSLTFTRLDNYRLHKRMKHALVPGKANILSLKCPKCEKSFSCTSNLRRHTRDTCNDKKKVYVLKCDGCDTTLIRTHDLKKHQQKRDNPDGSAKFLCTICDKKLCNRKLLMVHIKKEHAATIEKSSNAVKVHNEGRGVEGTETFECEFCGKRFAREDSVMQHKVTHKVVEKIECEKCQTKFSLRKSYKRHQKEALWEDGSPQHVCEFCDENFCNGKQLSGHINAYHKNFVCPLCDQSFTLKYNLERHVGNRVAVTCNKCGKVFCNNKSYTEHLDLLHSMSVN